MTAQWRTEYRLPGAPESGWRVLGWAFVLLVATLSFGCGSAIPPGPDLELEPGWFHAATLDQGGGVGRDASVYDAAVPPVPDLGEEPRLDELITLAFERNPALAAARERYRAAVSSYGEAVALPDPMVQWTTRPEPIQTRTGPQTDVYTLGQAIPFPAKLVLKGEIATDEARIARQSFLVATRDTMAELKQAFFELCYLDQAVGIVRQNQDLAQHLATAARSGVAERAEAGEVLRDGVSLMDGLKAEAQLTQLSYDLALLLEQRSAQATRLNRILDRPPAAPVGPPRPLPYRELHLDRSRLFDLVTRHRQELQIALLRVQKAGRMRELADLSWAPDFFIGGSLLATGSPIIDTPDAGNDAWGVTIGMTLPIWGSKNSSRVAQAEYARRAAIRERQDTFNRSLEAVDRLFFRLSNARRLVVMYRDQLVPQAREAMANAEQWHQIGRDEFGRILEAQGVWLNFTLALARSVADYQQTLAEIERTVGLPLGPIALGEPATPADDREGEER